MKHTTTSILTTLTLAALTLSSCGTGENTGDTSPSSNPTSESASPTASSVPTPTIGADHRPAQLTPQEWEKYVAGEYVPATGEHPAFNVPKPVLPEAASQESFEGAKAFWSTGTKQKTIPFKPVIAAYS